MSQLVSIKKYLSEKPPTPQEVFLRAIQSLIHGIGTHAVRCDYDDYARFRGEMLSLEKTLAEHPLTQAHAIADKAIGTMHAYNERLGQKLGERQTELHSIIGTLAETLTSLASSHERSVAALEALEKRLEMAAQVVNVPELKQQLSECLTGLQDERARQIEQQCQQTDDLQTGIERSKGILRTRALVTDVDPLTGLPERAKAERTLAKALEQGTPLYVGVAVVDRMASINASFGHGAGDGLILHYSQHLASSYPAAEELFRWTGPAFVLVLRSCQKTAHQIRVQLARISHRGVARKPSSVA